MHGEKHSSKSPHLRLAFLCVLRASVLEALYKMFELACVLATPLASALRVLSAEFRNERMMRAEEKAARLPAIMTVPLILFILPVLFIVILGPAACSLSDAMAGGSFGGR